MKMNDSKSDVLVTVELLSAKEKALESQSSSNDSSSNSGSRDYSDDETPRGNWSGRMDFLLSCIGYAIGLGNIWRFPYLCYKNGGGAFLIPYTIFLVLCGIPLFFLEVIFGQFGSLSPITIWRICPLFKGVGYGMVIISGIVCVYYNIIITWTLYYLYHSVRAVLPWSTCDNWWNTDRCYIRTSHANGTLTANGTLAVNGTLAANGTIAVNGSVMADPSSVPISITNLSVVQRMTASEEFWERGVLQRTSGIDDMGELRYDLLICLFVAWVVIFLCLCKGVKSSGKVVYFTATFPYLVLLILLVRGLTLPGAGEGLRFYLVPDFSKLKNFQVWGDAAVQIFYSIGPAWGGLITMASYNKFHNNCYRDAMIVPLVNCGTSLFAGLVIFSVLGFMAHETGVDIENVVTDGPGLAFVAYPEAMTTLPISPLWAVLFFLMLFTVGLDTQFGMFETMTSAFVDEFPHLLSDRKTLFTALMCFAEFLLGIPCIMQGGMYILQIMDWYCATFSLMILCLTECLAIAWIYGADRFYKDIELMIGYQPSCWWKICWCYISPTMIAFVWIFSVSQFSPVTYGDYHYPSWAIALGWVFGLVSLVPIPLCAVISICQQSGPLVSRIKKLCRPTDDFGPAVPEYREKYFASLKSRESYLPTLRNRRPRPQLTTVEVHLQASLEEQVVIKSS